MTFEGGFFGLIAENGQHWLPLNLAKKYQQDNALLKVTGFHKKGVYSIQQWGKPLKITGITLIKKGRKGDTTSSKNIN